MLTMLSCIMFCEASAISLPRRTRCPMEASSSIRNFSPAPYDPQKAKSLLAEMGFKPGPGGILVDPAGAQALSFTINTKFGQWHS